MTLQRMDNVLIVVDDLEAAKAFFVELGVELDVLSGKRDVGWQTTIHWRRTHRSSRPLGRSPHGGSTPPLGIRSPSAFGHYWSTSLWQLFT